MSRYKAYAEYKNSGVEMLGPLPEPWATMQVRYLLRDGGEGIKIGPFGSALRLEDMVDSGIRVYGQENVIQRDFSLGTRRISAEKFLDMAVYEVGYGDVLITMMGTSGKCILVPEEAEKGIIDSHLLRIRLNDKEIIPAFFRLLIDESFEIENQIKISGKGSIMHGLNSGIVKSLRLPLPSISEQISILKFLDHETAKIDALIEKQQRLIELLKEKRQAVISHAITKGLNPNAPMKDSGVEWLGEVPAHWNMQKLAWRFTAKKGSNAAQLTKEFCASIEGQHPVYSGQTENSGVMACIDSYEFDAGEEGYLFSTTVGAKAMTVMHITGRFSLSQNCMVIIPCTAYSIPRFYYYHFQPLFSYERGLIPEHMQASFRMEDLYQYKVLEPPKSEQIEIANFLDVNTAVFDDLISRSLNACLLLQERRTALISAAVTGKIDVRDWQAAA